MNAIPRLRPEQAEWMRKYRAETGCSLREAWDAFERDNLGSAAKPIETKEELLAKIADLESKLTQAQKDAERYRWIASKFHGVRHPIGPAFGCDEVIPGDDDFDSAVDAAVAAGRAKG